MALEVAPSAPIAQRRALLGPYLWIGFAGSLLVALTAPPWRLAGHVWRISLPGLPHNGERPITAIVFVLAVSMLGLAWLGMIGRLQRSDAPERVRMRAVMGAALLWFAPLLLGPPLLSSDIYSYAAEGAMVTKGLDPTTQDMSLLYYGDYITHTDPVWRRSLGNPYGPVQMGSAAAVVDVTNHNYNLTIWGLRILALLSVLASAWGIAEIARHYGVSPPVAVAIAIANPIAVLHLVGGAHNDSLLMALLATGAALALRGSWRWGVVVMALATGVKLPAAAAIIYLGWHRAGVGARLGERVRIIGKAMLASAAILLTMFAVIGISLTGWIESMKNSGKTMGTLSFTTRIGYVVSSMFRTVGLPSTDATWIGLFRFLGLAAAGAICLWLLFRTHRLGAIPAAGISMLVVMLLGPVVWPWYLAPAIGLLGAAVVGRAQIALLVLTVSFAFEVFPVGTNSKPVLEGNHFVSLGLILLIAMLTIASPFVLDWWRSSREEPPATEVVPAPAD